MTPAEIVDLFIQLDQNPVALVREIESRATPAHQRPKYDPATQPGSPEFDGAEAYQAHLTAMYPDESNDADPRISDSDAAYWITHRASIIDAITAAGFKLMSNKNGFWLLNVQDDEPIAEES